MKPHVVRGFKLSKDPMFTEKVRDVVGLYLNPPDNAIVLSVDEKSQCQALERAQCYSGPDLSYFRPFVFSGEWRYGAYRFT